MVPERIILNWSPVPKLPALGSDQVHLWCVNLTRPSAPISDLLSLLGADEQARAEKFHFEQDRDFYIVGRAILRTLISHYEQISAPSVAFIYGEQGKPELQNSDLQFNVSHAYGVALLGFCRGRQMGVDVELIRPLPNANRVAKRSFSQQEYEVWTAVPEPEKMHAFFNCWTRKEAYIKAIGQGLACPLGSFAVTLRPEEPAQLLHINHSPEAAAKWQLHSLIPAKGYVGAVLVEGEDWRFSQFAWQK